MRSGWCKPAELTHGASFLPPPGGGATGGVPTCVGRARSRAWPAANALLRSIARHAPDRIAAIVGDEQTSCVVEGHPDRPAEGLAAAVVLEEARQHVERRPLGPTV